MSDTAGDALTVGAWVGLQSQTSSLLAGPNLNPIGPCSVKMWGPRPHINFLTLMCKTFGR